MSENAKDVWTRAFKTFWQTGLALLTTAMPQVIELIPQGWVAIKPVLVTLGLSALSGAYCAAWNGVISPWLKTKKSVVGDISNATEEKNDEI